MQRIDHYHPIGAMGISAERADPERCLTLLHQVLRFAQGKELFFCPLMLDHRGCFRLAEPEAKAEIIFQKQAGNNT